MTRHWKQLLAIAAVGAAAMVPAAPAFAGVGVSIGVGVPGLAVGASFGGRGHYGGVGVVLPAPVYAPAPVAYYPPPAYYAPPVAYVPPPVVYSPPVYVAPRVYAPYYRPVVRGPVVVPRVVYRPGWDHGPRYNPPGPRGGYGPVSPAPRGDGGRNR